LKSGKEESTTEIAETAEIRLLAIYSLILPLCDLRGLCGEFLD
jgi:hypothetical protein